MSMVDDLRRLPLRFKLITAVTMASGVGFGLVLMTLPFWLPWIGVTVLVVSLVGPPSNGARLSRALARHRRRLAEDVAVE